jgi:hypothetical protein
MTETPKMQQGHSKMKAYKKLFLGYLPASLHNVASATSQRKDIYA